MKKIITLVLVFVTLCAITVPAMADKYVVTTEKDPLNIRGLPQGEIIGSVPKGKVVDVLRTEKYDGKDWAVIEYEGCQVYLYGEYLTKVESGKPLKVEKPQSSEAVQKKAPAQKAKGVDPTVDLDGAELYQVVCNSAGLNVRKGPSGKQKILNQVETGAYVWVLERTEDGKWAKVMFKPNRTGYVQLEYLAPVTWEDE